MLALRRTLRARRKIEAPNMMITNPLWKLSNRGVPNSCFQIPMARSYTPKSRITPRWKLGYQDPG